MTRSLEWIGRLMPRFGDSKSAKLKARQSEWRAAWLAGIGGLAEEKTPLNAKVGSVVACDGFTLQNVLRCPMIPGVNDFPANLKALAVLADELKGVTEIDIEPYVAYGIDKAHKLGLKVYEAPSAPPEYAEGIILCLSALTLKKIKKS